MQENNVKGDGSFLSLVRMRQNPWILATLFLAVVLVVYFFTKGSLTGNVVSESAAAERLVSFANAQGVNLSVTDVVDEGSFYQVTLTVNGQESEVYITKDGGYLIQPLASLTEEVNNSQSAGSAKAVPKTDKPTVELFVMSFCPYGLEGEKLLKPVYDLLKNKVDFKIRFFATPGGTKIEDVQSLHGNLEAQEDARQVCIDKYYPEKLWDYVFEIASTCPTAYKNATELSICWKNAANKIKISISKIEECYANEVPMILNRFNEDGALISKYGLGGSESLVINGIHISAASYRWDSEKVKTLICNAFTTAPSECSSTLTSSSSGASAGAGSCS